MIARWLRHRIAVRLAARAWAQAMAEHGIPSHWQGRCPTPECDCEDKADLVAARAVQIVESWYGRPLAEVPS